MLTTKLPQLRPLRQWRAKATQWFLERALGAEPEILVFLGDRAREFVPCARIRAYELWADEPFSHKAHALLRRHWKPNEDVVQTQARHWYKKLCFGDVEDCGDHLAILNDWHARREWTLGSLNGKDWERADALATFTVLTRLRYENVEAPWLKVRLAMRAPYVAGLIYPMVAKMPVLSLQYYLDLHVHFAFNAVRHAKHPHGDDIISFLYDLLFLQQKTSLALLEYGRLMAYVEKHKGQALLINAETDAILNADILFAYLKASVEKTIALVGVTHGIENLESKKEHKKRVEALRAGLPPGIERLPYGEFLFSMVASENLNDLNNYRSGLLHKKGIADLQPHNFVGRSSERVPLRKIFGVVHDQHCKNTALLLVALALLTDRLVELDAPPFGVEDLPTKHKFAETRRRLQAEELVTSEAIERARTADQSVPPTDLLLVRAELRLNLGRSREAIVDFKEALSGGAKPKADILYRMGKAIMDSDDPERDRGAVDAFTRAIAISPGMDQAYVARALAYENLGELALAVTDLDVIIPRMQYPALLLEKRGRLRIDLAQYAGALADFDAAASLGLESVDLHVGRAVALRELGDLERSIAGLNEAVERYPDAVVARLQRAVATLQSGDITVARADLDRIIERNADHWKAHAAFAIRAGLRSETGDLAGAVSDMEQAVARAPDPARPGWAKLLDEIRAKLAPATPKG